MSLDSFTEGLIARQPAESQAIVRLLLAERWGRKELPYVANKRHRFE
jgi:hypothetical protein